MKRLLPLLILCAGCGGSDRATVATPAALVVDDDDFEFDPLANEAQSASTEFIFSNSGGQPSGTLSAELNGNDSDAFVIVGDTCSNRALSPSDLCRVAIALAGPTAGTLEADLRVRGAPGGLAKVHLHGNVADARLAVAPPSVDFGTVTTSKSLALTITNVGGASSGPITLALPTAAQVTIDGDHCSAQSLAGGQSCTLEVVYRPVVTDSAPVATALGVASLPGGALSIPISGLPLAQPTIAVESYDFGSYGARFSTFGIHSLLVTNIGGQTATVSGVALASGTTGASGFFISADHCTGQLAPGATCTVAVQPVPHDAGSLSDTLDVTVSNGQSGDGKISGTANNDYISGVIEISQPNGGVVKSSDGQSCYSNCPFYWPLGATGITLTATPLGSFKFMGWAGTFCQNSSPASCTFTPTNGLTMEALFD